jgi:hypothetical protein
MDLGQLNLVQMKLTYSKLSINKFVWGMRCVAYMHMPVAWEKLFMWFSSPSNVLNISCFLFQSQNNSFMLLFLHGSFLRWHSILKWHLYEVGRWEALLVTAGRSTVWRVNICTSKLCFRSKVINCVFRLKFLAAAWEFRILGYWITKNFLCFPDTAIHNPALYFRNL